MGFSLSRAFKSVTRPLEKAVQKTTSVFVPNSVVNVVKKAATNPLISPVTAQLGLSKTAVTKASNFAQDNFSLKGALNPVAAIGTALVSPLTAVNLFPRESLLAAGAVGAGSYAAGATAANTAAATASVAAPVAAVAGSTALEKAGEFVVETAIMDQIAKKQNSDNVIDAGSYASQAGAANTGAGISSMSLKDIVNHPLAKVGFAAISVFAIVRGMS